ncbi:MAG: cysteinyl-tRNA synthetase [Actinomycetota bacterium]|nr:cysteinyl-tRNA synthetase [Actinomycetota bacterium]
MSLRLYDTATRSVRDFQPLREGAVSIYHCGLTVQAEPHVGHIRKEVVFDVLRRWLTRLGYDVTIIANITDIDDKILAKSAEEGRPWWAHAYENERWLNRAYDVLGCLPPTYEPRATGHIPEMIELMDTLIERGHAYPADDASGDVYFDVRSWPSYGELSGMRIDEMEAAADADPRGKRDPRDFALWKGHKPDEPVTASWASPWGRGRPGWHLECSAMAGKYLGDEFDIHGGGIDLRFPHHENEIAQSKAAGQRFARWWMHNAWVTTSGEKMSKSLGNSLLVREVVKRVRPIELRYYLVAAHYRSHVEFSFDALDEAAAAFRRIEGYVRRATELVGDVSDGVLCAEFAEAMDDDLSVPAALAALQGVIREGNKLVLDGASDALRGNLASVRAMLDVLGVDPLSPPWSEAADGSDLHDVVDRLVAVALEERAAARARKDYAAADRIRDRLTVAGVAVEDTPDGPRWTLSGSAPTDDLTTDDLTTDDLTTDEVQ